MAEPTQEKASWSLLIDDDGNVAIGEVSDTPGEYTILGRLKAIKEGVAVEAVSLPSGGGTGRAVLAASDTLQRIVDSSTPMNAGVTIVADSNNAGTVWVFRNQSDTYGFPLTPTSPPVFHECSDLYNIWIKGNAGDTVYFIWS